MESRLEKIIQRLQAMVLDMTDDVQTRRFETQGRWVVTVHYSHLTTFFTVVKYETKEKYVFDSIDLAAIEIFERLLATESKQV